MEEQHTEQEPDEQQAVFPDCACVLNSAAFPDASLTHAVHLIKDDIAQLLDPIPVSRGEQQDLQAGWYCHQDTCLQSIDPVVAGEDAIHCLLTLAEVLQDLRVCMQHVTLCMQHVTARMHHVTLCMQHVTACHLQACMQRVIHKYLCSM